MKPLKTQRLIVYPLFFAVIYFYVCFRIDPALIYLNQDPIFYLGRPFFLKFLLFPGGVADYVAALMAQSFVFTWAGSLVITLLLLGILIQQRLIFKTPSLFGFMHLLPVVFLLFLISSYSFPLSVTVGFLAALAFFYLYSALKSAHWTIRSGVFLFLSTVLFWIAGGMFFLFVVLCLISEWFQSKRSAISRILILMIFSAYATILPWLGREFVFMVTLRNAYFHPIPAELKLLELIALILLIFSVPVMFVMSKSLGKQDQGQQPLSDRLFARVVGERSLILMPLKGLLFLLASGLILYFGFNSGKHAQLRVDYFAKHRQWDKVLQAATRCSVHDGWVLYQINRALYHSGRLCESIFYYPQIRGVMGLFVPRPMQYKAAIINSDLFFELGHINEAKRWAHEAISQTGESPWAFKRLFETSLISDELEMADAYLTQLKKNLVLRRWAHSQSILIENSEAAARTEWVQKARARMPLNDFIVKSTNTYMDIDFLSQDHPDNKMAFEYFMMSCLLRGKMGTFVNRLSLLKNLNYTRLPKHFEEAVVMYVAETKRQNIDLAGFQLSRKTVESFQDFVNTFNTSKMNKTAARPELYRKFHDTFWYYVVYYKPSKNENENESENENKE